MTEIVTVLDNIKVIKKFDLFKLGICQCNCNISIPIRSKHRGELRRYTRNHHAMGSKNPIHKRNLFRENNPAWNGGKRKTTQGYVQILTENGYIYEHRLVYEQYYNVCLLPWTEIHHINGIKDDNRIQNLVAISKSEHMRIHMMGNTYAKR